MARAPSVGISLCAGGGGLDMGLGLAEPGFASAVYCDIDEYPRTVLAAAQAAGYFHPAPIWDDLKRFSGRPWNGIADTLLAGYPCQPFSQAGQRKGADDPRHLWPHIARIIAEIDSLEWLFFENVAGHVTLGLSDVLRDIRGLGFRPAVGLFTAAETGAAHERQRLFIVAHRSCARRQQVARRTHGDEGADEGRRAQHYHQPSSRGASLANPDGGHAGAEREQRGGQQRLHAPGRGTGGGDVGHAAGLGRGEGRPEPVVRRGRDAAASASRDVDDAAGARRSPARIGADLGSAEQQGGERLSCDGRGDMADASGAGHQKRRGVPGVSILSMGAQPGEATNGSRTHFHAPGPADMAAWHDTIVADGRLDLLPAASLDDAILWADYHAAALGGAAQAAAEPAVRRMADGLAARSRALRLLGNGVVPLVAGYAWRTLAAAHGLGCVDLGGADA